MPHNPQYVGIKAAPSTNDAVQTGNLHVEEWNELFMSHPAQIHLQIDQHKIYLAHTVSQVSDRVYPYYSDSLPKEWALPAHLSIVSLLENSLPNSPISQF